MSKSNESKKLEKVFIRDYGVGGNDKLYHNWTAIWKTGDILGISDGGSLVGPGLV